MKFKSAKIGDQFYYRNTLYIKTWTMYSYLNVKGRGAYNPIQAIRLDMGMPMPIDGDEEVAVVKKTKR